MYRVAGVGRVGSWLNTCCVFLTRKIGSNSVFVCNFITCIYNFNKCFHGNNCDGVIFRVTVS